MKVQNVGKGFLKNITEASIGKIAADGVDTEIANFNRDGLLDIYISCFRGGDVLLIQNRHWILCLKITII